MFEVGCRNESSVAFYIRHEQRVILLGSTTYVVWLHIPSNHIFGNICFCDFLRLWILTFECFFIEAAELRELIEVLTARALKVPFADWLVVAIGNPL